MKGWIARDEDGTLHLFKKKPERCRVYDCTVYDFWRSYIVYVSEYEDEIEHDGEKIYEDELPEGVVIRWEDEPIEVEYKLRYKITKV